jgi:hypothetical protein
MAPAPPLMKYQPMAESDRRCAYTYISEKELVRTEGRKLLQCTKCKETCYKDRESQTAHWPIHKLTCCAIEKDDPRINLPFASIDACIRAMAKLAGETTPASQREPMKGRFFLYGLQYILKYFKQNKPLDDYEQRQVMGWIIAPLKELTNKELHIMWGIPGFVCFMLSDDIYLSHIMKEWKELGKDPPPNEIYPITNILDPKTRYDPSWQIQRKEYWEMMEAFFIISTGFDEGRITQHALTYAILRRHMQSWACPYSRVSFPSCCPTYDTDPWTTRGNFYLSTFMVSFDLMTQSPDLLKKYLIPGEVLPGLSAKELLHVLMVDESFFKTIELDIVEKVALGLYLTGRNQESEPGWKDLTPEDRVDLLQLFLDWKSPAYNIPHKLVQCNLGTVMCQLVLGGFDSTPIFLKMAKAAQEMCPRPSRDVLNYIRSMKDFSLSSTTTAIKTYVDLVEPHYQRRMDDAGMKPQNLPAEVMDLIGEYCLSEDEIMMRIRLIHDKDVFGIAEGKGSTIKAANELNQLKERRRAMRKGLF